jgi:hypothetical protein
MTLFKNGELDLARDRMPIFQAAAAKYSWPEELNQAMQADLGTSDWMTWVLAGIDSRESHMGLSLDEDGLGDAGHGHGEMQIDDRSHGPFCASGQWRDLAASLEYVHHNVIIPSYNYLADRFGYFGENYVRLFWGVVAAYNCGMGNVAKAVAKGQDPDSRTAGGDYSADVRARALALKEALG